MLNILFMAALYAGLTTSASSDLHVYLTWDLLEANVPPEVFYLLSEHELCIPDLLHIKTDELNSMVPVGASHFKILMGLRFLHAEAHRLAESWSSNERKAKWALSRSSSVFDDMEFAMVVVAKDKSYFGE